MDGPSRREVLAATAALGATGARTARAEPAAAQSGVNWAMYQRDAANTGFAPGAALSGTMETAWTHEMADERGTPVVVDVTVFVSAFTEGMYAVDAATGTREWHALDDLSGTVSTGPAVADGTVYAGGSDYPCLAVDAATGDLRWTVEEGDLGSGMVTAPTVVDGSVYAAHDGGTLFALDAATGEQQWTVDVEERSQPGPPAVADGVVYLASGGTQYALDAATGERRWTNEPESYPASPFVVGDGRCYFLTQEELVAIDAGTKERLWSYPVPGITFDPPTLVDGSVIVKGESHVSRLDAGSGTIEWTFRDDLRATSREAWTEMEADVYLGGPVAATDGALYVRSRGDFRGLLELDASTGDVQDRYPIEEETSVTSSPVLAEGSIYLLTSDDELVAVRGSDARGAAPTSTPPGQDGDDLAPGGGENAPRPSWLYGWSTLLAWLVGVPVVGSVVLAALVVAVDRYGDERTVEGDDGS